MKRILLIAPVLIATMAVGFILYRGTSLAEGQDPAVDADVSSSAAEEAYGAAGDAYGVPEDIIFTEPVEAVAFSHETHAVEMGYKCDSCHGGLFEMKAHSAEAQPDFTMAGLAEGKYCGACHSAETKVAFASDTQCARCHIGVKGLEEE